MKTEQVSQLIRPSMGTVHHPPIPSADTVEAQALPYEVHGAGPPLVLAVGVNPATLWRPLLQALSQHFRVIVFAKQEEQINAAKEAGAEVRLFDGEVPAGDHRVVWSGRTMSGRPVAAGIYFLRLETLEGTRTGRIVRLR